MAKLPVIYKALIILLFVALGGNISAQSSLLLKGKVTDEAGKPLSFATISSNIAAITVQTQSDGTFAVPVTSTFPSVDLLVSHVGKETVIRNIAANQFSQFQLIKLRDQSLQLATVEVNGLRKATISSNSSIVFDREAISQSQPFSIANVLNYLPGQTILRPNASIQGVQNLNIRSATSLSNVDGLAGRASLLIGTQQLNEAFGISVMVDGASISNNANMQASNPGFLGMFSANNIDHITVSNGGPRRNGTLYGSYGAAGANMGLDLRQLSAENVEDIEVITGVASARYGDYTTGVVAVRRQAGVSPLRMTFRNNAATQQVGVNKGFKLSDKWGTANISVDFLNANDDPRDRLKAYRRVGASFLWTYQQKKGSNFKNTLGVDYNTTLDQTKQDPDLDNMQMAKFTNRYLRLSNRSEWLLRKPWIYNIRFDLAYSTGHEESYDQRYLSGASILSVLAATETGVYEGYHAPGYYMAYHHIIGKPVTASARLEASNLIRFNSHTYRLVVGLNTDYSANKGPGTLNDPTRPRFDYIANKNDRPRPFDVVPAIMNAGAYLENIFNGKIWNRNYSANIGVRADRQNGFNSISPRANIGYAINKKLQWKAAYGIAVKSPGLAQISPGNVYFDFPLINIYNDSNRLLLGYTRVIEIDRLPIKPYRSYTFETGFNFDMGKIHGSVFYFNRTMRNGFTTATQVVPITIPQYRYILQGANRPVYYEPTGRDTTIFGTYSIMQNGNYSRTNGLELILTTDKIKSIQTSFNLNTSFYSSYYRNSVPGPNLGTTGQGNIDYTKEALFAVYNNQEAKATGVKSTVITNTHIPNLRMVIMLTGEIFWMSKAETLPSSVYPVGYLDRTGAYHELKPEEARSAAYAHLVKADYTGNIIYSPPMVYSNVHLRLSKEITNVLRLSFNAYNVFNIRPSYRTTSGIDYYNGQPSYGAELTFTIK